MGAISRSPWKSTHFRFPSMCGITVIRSTMSFLILALLGEGVPLSGPIRGQTRPKGPVP